MHVIGAGPVGLLLTAMLQSMDGFSRPPLRKAAGLHPHADGQAGASYLVADSLESYRADRIDGENVEALFDPQELEDGIAFRRAMPPDLMALLRDWTLGFCPLNTIERALSDLIDGARRGPGGADRTAP